MATKTWTGNAADVVQIQTITIGGTWSGTESATVTCNGKDVTVTIVTDNATAELATSIKEALMASQRLDGTSTYGTYDNTSNVGGQQFGEFMDFTATVSGSVVTLTARWPGIPFTVTVSEASSSGTITLGTVQAATGSEFWSNADNWDSGTVPANDDTVVFKNSSVSCKYGLPAGSLEVTLLQHQSFEGAIGLPEINNTHAGKPYREYRARAVHLDDAGGGTEITHVLGFGEGSGSPLINIYHPTSALIVNVDVHNTGRPQTNGEFAQHAGAKAVNLSIVKADGEGEINVRRGSVGIIPQIGANSEFAVLRIGHSTSDANDADVLLHNHNDMDLSIVQNGGRLQVQHSDGENSAIVTVTQYGGTAIFEDFNVATGVSITSYDGTIVWNTTETITSLTLGTNSTFDAERDVRPFTITALDMFNKASLLDEYARITYTAGIDLNRCGLDDVTVRVGNNRRLTIGSVA